MIFAPILANSQFRNVYNAPVDNQIQRISFFSPSQGYIAVRSSSGPWMGYTADSGHIFTHQPVTISHIDYGLNPINLTFGFSLNGVKAIDQTHALVYGDFGAEPSILYTADAGATFKLVYWQAYNFSMTNTIKDLVFTQNNLVGYAIDEHNVFVTTNGGASWSVSLTLPGGSTLTQLQAADNNNVIALTTGAAGTAIYKFFNGGITPVQVPGRLTTATFLNTSTGWANALATDGSYKVYKTTDGGTVWNLVNDGRFGSIDASRMKFTDANTGYAIWNSRYVYKTTDEGRHWEPLQLNGSDNIAYRDFQLLSTSQIWAAGSAAIDMTTNGGNSTTPGSYFTHDTTGLVATGKVTMTNFSRTDLQFTWLVNGTVVSHAYNASYTHDLDRTSDTITLQVSNGVVTTSNTVVQAFYPRTHIYSFTPNTGAEGDTITVTGANLSKHIYAVTIGDVPVTSFTVVSPTQLQVLVGSGASGQLKVFSTVGNDSLPGFVFIPPPRIASFTPMASTAGSTVTITGTNFGGLKAVYFDSLPAASFTLVSPTTITAVTPSGRSGYVRVDARGGTGIATGYIAIPTMSAYTPNEGTVGSVLNITGTSLSDINKVTVGGVDVLSFTINSASGITASVGNGSSGDVQVSKTGATASLPGYTWYAAPVVNSFSPLSGPAGTTVTITGNNFNIVAGNNRVYFGAVQATVVSATSTVLMVTVPAGATFKPISVYNVTSHLTGYAQQPFLLGCTGCSFSGNTFAARDTIVSPGNITGLALGDLDGDGKSDIVTILYENAPVLVYRNSSSAGKASFDNPVSFSNAGGKEPVVKDVDGDGKPDIILVSDVNALVMRNTSSPGALSFETSPPITNAGSTNNLLLEDLDADGKPDLVTSIGMVFRNTSVRGTVAFAAGIKLVNPVSQVSAVDLNGDHKPELIFAGDSTYVFNNTSQKGIISFASPVAFGDFPGTYYYGADVDGDGKTDLVGVAAFDNKAGVLRNTGDNNNFAFTPVVLPGGQHPAQLDIADVDGDGKPDFASTTYAADFMVYHNLSSPGKIAFQDPVGFKPGDFLGERHLALGDIDGDGKVDAVTSFQNYDTHSIAIHLNAASPAPTLQALFPTSGKIGDTIMLTGTQLTGATAVIFGDSAAASFTVLSPDTIRAVLGTGSTGSVKVITPLGTASVPGFKFLPSIKSFTPATGAAGTLVTITGNGFYDVRSIALEYAYVDSFSVVSDKIIVARLSNSVTGTFFVETATGTCQSAATFNYVVTPTPVIKAVIPNSGDVGSTITITGEHLTSAGTPYNVHFGSVRANVLNASANTITVQVPAGSEFDQVSVTSGYLTAFSGVPFTTTFPGNHQLSAASFGKPMPVATISDLYGDNPQVYARDIDGDGRLDIIRLASYGFWIQRNTSSGGLISFDTAQHFVFTNTSSPVSISLPTSLGFADIDGDGKQDICQVFDYGLNIRRNTSVPGTFSFDTTRTDYAGNSHIGLMQYFSTIDINKDGRPDIARQDQNSFGTIYMNDSWGSKSRTYTDPIDLPYGNYAYVMREADMDGDGMPDFVTMTFNNDAPAFFIARTLPGNQNIYPYDYQDAGAVQFFITKENNKYGTDMQVTDIDGDGKADVVTGGNWGITIFPNHSTAGTLLLSDSINVDQWIGIPRSISVNDVNGDGKTDLILTKEGVTDSVFILENNSSPGKISFAKPVAYYTGNAVQTPIAADLNGDGKPELISILSYAGAGKGGVIVLSTQPDSLVSRRVCAGSSLTLTTEAAANSYQWQQDNGTGFVNLGNTAPFAGVNTRALTIQTVPTSFNNNRFRCLADGTAGAIYVLSVDSIRNNSVTIIASKTTVCNGDTVVFTAQPSAVLVHPHYQWMVNNVKAGKDSTGFIAAGLTNNSQVSVQVTTDSTGPCYAGIINSNTITIITTSQSIPAITITGNANVVQDSSTTIKATVTNGGNGPVYQWQDSTAQHSWLNIAGATAGSITYKPVTTGDKLRCILTSNASCISTPQVSSNSIGFTVVSPIRSTGARSYPNPAGSTISIDDLLLADAWQTLDIMSLNAGNRVITMNIPGMTSVQVNIDKLSRGFYVVVLTNNQGSKQYLRFLKL